MSEDREQYYHNKGQSDASNGEYDRPHGIFEDLTTWTDTGMKRIAEDNIAYDQGYEHTSNQIKVSK